MHARLMHALAIVVLLATASTVFANERVQQSDPRFFSETGYRISNDDFWDFFQRRGGTRTFGLPTSREITFQGFVVQFFQRSVMQKGKNGVETLNLLDDGLLPYTTINGSTFPAANEALIKAAPTPSDPAYSDRMIEFVKANAPDTWEGLPVNFSKTFASTVTYDDAFPNGEGPASLLPLINLQIWGAPTSKPMRDPKNDNFVYLRFQRGIMHYDDTCKCTQGLLLGDYLKALLTGENLPIDLEAQAAGSPLLRQYEPGAADGLARPDLLLATNLKNGFEKQAAGQASTAPAPLANAAPQPPSAGQGNRQAAPRASASPAPAARQAAAPATRPQRAASPEYGMNIFLWGNERTTDRDLKRLTDAGFGWQKTLFQWRYIEPQKGKFDWAEADRVVKASKANGVKIIARLDQQPDWARRDKVPNGPPDNYQDFADFVTAFVTRYSSTSQIGRVDAIQVWNEQNLTIEWGNRPINQQQAVDYVRLLKAAYEAAKAADPSVTVITGGVAQTGTDNDQARPDDVYVQWMYDAGARPYFDVLGAHGHGYKAPPTVSPDEAESDSNWGGHRFFVFRRVEDMRKIMEDNGDGDKQIWLLEFGWTSDTVNQAYAWHRVSEEEKGDNLVGAYKWAAEHWSPWIGVMCLWTMPDPSWTPSDEKYWWAILNPDGSPRPAYDRLLKARREGVLR
ncbi:MAG: cellulase family glycosylhydrolase [Chloroflexi bacterium]|nr:cellulase family glycosylhydrolase [Chloroflexota bacterium]